METNDKHNSSCRREAELLTYLYAEATLGERKEFETHLLVCTLCTDEFAELADARFTVFEWQREDFAPLATPKIEIPYPAAQAVGGWVRIRSLLSFRRPALAMAAVLVLTLSGLGLWVAWPTHSPEQQIVNNKSSKIVPYADDSAIAEMQGPENIVANRGSMTKVKAKTEVLRMSAPRVSRQAVAGASNIRRLEKERTVAELRKQERPLPSLTAEADEEDGSLRLADMFDNLDGKL